MKKKYWHIIISIIVLSSISKIAFSVTPPGIIVHCNIDKDFLNNNVSLEHNRYNYNISDSQRFISVIVSPNSLSFIAIGGGGENIIYYNNSIVNDTKFYFIKNFCKEDIEPILNMMKEKSFRYHTCEFYNSNTDDAELLSYTISYTEKLGSWTMRCGNPEDIIIPTFASLIFGLIFTTLDYYKFQIIASIVVIIIIFIFAWKKLNKHKGKDG